VDYSHDSQELYVTFFGGEPALHFRGIQVATAYLEEKLRTLDKKLNLDTTSNGVLLTPEMIDYCAVHNINVLLSVDGLRPSHDRYRAQRGRVPTSGVKNLAD
jgi:uncharacterized protein